MDWATFDKTAERASERASGPDVFFAQVVLRERWEEEFNRVLLSRRFRHTRVYMPLSVKQQQDSVSSLMGHLREGYLRTTGRDCSSFVTKPGFGARGLTGAAAAAGTAWPPQ